MNEREIRAALRDVCERIDEGQRRVQGVVRKAALPAMLGAGLAAVGACSDPVSLYGGPVVGPTNVAGQGGEGGAAGGAGGAGAQAGSGGEAEGGGTVGGGGQGGGTGAQGGMAPAYMAPDVIV